MEMKETPRAGTVDVRRLLWSCCELPVEIGNCDRHDQWFRADVRCEAKRSWPEQVWRLLSVMTGTFGTDDDVSLGLDVLCCSL